MLLRWNHSNQSSWKLDSSYEKNTGNERTCLGISGSSMFQKIFPLLGGANGDRFASGRWTPDKFRLSYFWNHGISLGFVNCKPSGSPHTIASISAPATEMMAQDNWTDMRSEEN